MTGQNIFSAPKRKADPLAGHVMHPHGFSCARCGQPTHKIESEKLSCISDQRVAGNEAIGRLVRR